MKTTFIVLTSLVLTYNLQTALSQNMNYSIDAFIITDENVSIFHRQAYFEGKIDPIVIFKPDPYERKTIVSMKIGPSVERDWLSVLTPGMETTIGIVEKKKVQVGLWPNMDNRIILYLKKDKSNSISIDDDDVLVNVIDVLEDLVLVEVEINGELIRAYVSKKNLCSNPLSNCN